MLSRILPIDARTFTGDFDLFHDTDYAEVPVKNRPRVATLYDTAYLGTRGYVSEQQAQRMTSVVRRILDGVQHVITISDFARGELESAFGIDPANITVAPLGVDPLFRTPVSDEVIEETRTRHGIRGPYIMYLGTLEPRKNLVRLVRAFARLVEVEPEFELALVGRPGYAVDRIKAVVAEEGIENSVHWVGRVNDEDALALLKGADVFAYPSLYEGFGLPALEGMAAGVPVLAGDSPALREVCGDGALLVNPSDELALFEGLRTLALDRGEAFEIAARGRARADQFSWANCAERTLEVYRKVLGDNAP